MKIASIVEGHGEVSALPVLLRRFLEWRPAEGFIEIERPNRVPRDRFINLQDEFVRFLRLARIQCGEDGWILILLDADDDCPVELATALLARAREIDNRRVSVVIAKREFEAWFIGAAASLDGHRGLTVMPADLNAEAELPRDAKGWLGARMKKGSYGAVTDQPAFASLMDLQQASDRCRSFRKLCTEWDVNLGRIA
ncbi:DUF4276 family protein [Burkholderia ubonensis]|uniref:DUF4276 family protein n=1 Tax=Burkholderia ubonensis TaxID=101571 RepID=A0A1R1JES5_9BURK|nr:DUF4276 family protein [Burkholderia ubonensis]OMG73866.1 hypothetical protein BW685_07495 [Burkholderia ubonensis]